MSQADHDAFDAALHIIKKLRAAGFVALLAGGCVRDKLLSLIPKDYDVATNANPEQILAGFPRAKQVGLKFGVAVVRKFGHDIEVATFRKDGHYSDGRRPDEVEFGSEIEDVRRRDFTINGMFCDPISDEIIDHVGGRADLAARIVRTIGAPDQRFGEDHLRMLRAVRFAARLDFSIEPKTLAAICRLAHKLRSISPERIWLELKEMLASPTRSRAWSLLVKTTLSQHLSASWSTIGDADDTATTVRRLASLPPVRLSPEVGLAALLAQATSADVAAIGRSLRLSNREIDTVGWLVGALPMVQRGSELALADLKLLLRHGSWAELLDLLRADLLARDDDVAVHQAVAARGEAVDPARVNPTPLIGGDDLKATGVEPSKKLGDVLFLVYRAQLNEEISTRDEAMDLARRQLRRSSDGSSEAGS